MKKIYIAPAQLEVSLLGTEMLASSVSAHIDGTPEGIDMGKPGAGNAWDASVKSHNIWDEEW